VKIKLAIPIVRKTLLIMKANPRYAGWRLDRGPFNCWELYLGRIKIGWVLTRWL